MNCAMLSLLSGIDAWFMLAHEIGYGISTILSAYIVVERLFLDFFQDWNVQL